MHSFDAARMEGRKLRIPGFYSGSNRIQIWQGNFAFRGSETEER